MKIYHGTSAKNLKSILNYGIKPRGRGNRKSNWDHTVISRVGHVYMTTAYALYFALCAKGKGDMGLVVEIDTGKLDESWLYPDEDFIAQALEKTEAKHGVGNRPTLNERTAQIDLESYRHCWEKSLEYMGNCSYRGPVPSSAITRYATIDFKKRPEIAMTSMDPSICIDNYRFCGWKYRGLVAWLFGDGPMPGVVPPEMLGQMKAFAPFQQQQDAWEKAGADRTGIEVVRL